MTATDFIKEFELLADAPNGVRKLREMILQLAVQGKLVPQDTEDEPAGGLLEDVQEERKRLIEQGVIKKPRTARSSDSNRDAPALPCGWCWTSLGMVAEVLMGQSPPGASYNEDCKGVPLINGPAEFSRPAFGETIARQYTTSPTKMCNKGDLLVCVRGATTGRTNIAAGDLCIGRGVAAIQPYIFARFVHWFMVYASNHLLNIGTGSTFPSVSFDKIASVPLPLPPLAEQKRIVAKVDELMRLCDELEVCKRKRDESRIALNASCLSALVRSEATPPQDVSAPTTRRTGTPEWAKPFRRIRDNFDILYDTPATVAELRKTILQLAVQGRLVPQDPNDEGVDLAVITEKVASLAPAIRRTRRAVALSEGTHACSFPDSWTIALFGTIAHIQGGVTKGRKLDGKPTIALPYLRVANVQRGYLDLSKMKEILVPLDEVEKYVLQQGDLLVTEGGDWDKVGRTAIWGNEIETCLHQNHVFRARVPTSLLSNRWIALFINSGVGRAYFAQSSKQTTNLASINMTQLRACPIPLPPLAEQKRIVAKVDELMSLCDALETKLTQSREDADTIVSAVVHSLCNQAAISPRKRI